MTVAVNDTVERYKVIQRFESYYEPVTASGCWLWLLRLTPAGYGLFVLGERRNSFAHRVSYELFNGPLIAGMHVHHICLVRCCVNPAHLKQVTPRENIFASTAPSILIRKSGACSKGHVMTDSNTYIFRGFKYCRECRRAVDKERYKKYGNRRKRHEVSP